MSKKHEVIIIGGGHNGLTVACYLAKAGVDVCVFEAASIVGGCVISPELAATGFKTDICSVGHIFIQGNPLLFNDELGLKSKFGLEYIVPENLNCLLFPDDSHINQYRDLDRTCESIAKFSDRDAESYRKFYEWGTACLDVIVQGLYNPPLPFGSMVAMLDESEEGRGMLRALMISALDICNDWFESKELKIALTKFASEACLSPHTKGSGLVLFLLVPFIHRYGGGFAKGGSGALSDAMERCILHYGGTIHKNTEVANVIVLGDAAKGVVLKNGEEIVATKAVISSLNAKQIPDLVGLENVPESYALDLKKLTLSHYGFFSQGYALHEMPQYIAGQEVGNCAFIEFAPKNIIEYLKSYYNLELGIPCTNMPGAVCQTVFDPSRAPENKHTLYLIHHAPNYLSEGGIEKWDEIRETIADGVLATFKEHTTNMESDNIIGRVIETPLDLERRNPAMIGGDPSHLGMFLNQTMGNRYLPGWGYRTPVRNFWMCGPSCHPGGGVMGGGRAAVQPVMEDLGIDFEEVIRK